MSVAVLCSSDAQCTMFSLLLTVIVAVQCLATLLLKGLFTNLFLLFKAHILDSNGVWSVPNGYPNPTRYPVFFSIPDPIQF